MHVQVTFCERHMFDIAKFYFLLETFHKNDA